MRAACLGLMVLVCAAITPASQAFAQTATQTPTASTATATPTFPGGGGCGSPNTKCIPTILNGKWALLRRAADMGNSELDCYDPANAVQSGGFLTLTLRRQSQTCYYGGGASNSYNQNYTSEMVMSYPFSFTYGTVEARIKFGRGWPAFWLLGGSATAHTGCQISNVISAENILTCNWDSDASDSAEIDIAEYYESNTYAVNTHHVFSGGGFNCGNDINVSPDAVSAFHVYTLTWAPGKLTFGVDGVTTSCSDARVPSHPMFIMINNTLSNSNNSVPPSFPQVTTIDYVKVTDQNSNVIFFDDFLDPTPPPPPTLLNVVPIL